jgi:acyl-CoA reductase-like NAD-dependent aldehyde dehydrogenase
MKMNALPQKGTIKTLSTHYIDGAFVESHGKEVIDIIRPTDGQIIAHATLGDEEDARRAIAAAKRVRDLRSDDQGRALKDLAPAA